MAGALLCFEEEVVFTEFLEDGSDMLYMLRFGPRIHQDVIYVNDDEMVEVLLEQFVHVPLEYGWCIYQAIRHYETFVMAGRGHERRLPLISLADPDQVIGAAEIQLGEDPGVSKMLEGGWDEWKGVTVFDCDLVESTVVYAGT